jgi:hypothetical protein
MVQNCYNSAELYKLRAGMANDIKKELEGADQKASTKVQQTFSKMGLTPEAWAKMMQGWTEEMSCQRGSECWKRKKRERLQKQFLKAEKNFEEAPVKYRVAEKKYFTSLDDPAAYKNALRTKYDETAKKIKAESLERHNEIMRQLNTLVKDYEAEHIYAKRMYDLLAIKKEENKELHLRLQQDTAATSTNDRKVVYEEYEREKIISSRKIVLYIYYLLLVLYLVMGGFIRKSEYKKVKVWVLLLLYGTLPYFINRISSGIMNIYKQLQYIRENKLPKNVYTDI